MLKPTWASLSLLQFTGCINDYMAIDSDGYLCMNSLHLIAVWMDASNRS